MQLRDKKIILGITGSIAAYKAASLVRLLIKEGAEVKVVMTPLAKEFITPVTLATLSKNSVISEFFSYDDGAWNSHVELGVWADLFLVAPATANTMAKLAYGICDNLLLTTYLSCRCPVMLAPAMDLDMFQHPATLHNRSVLIQRGNLIVEPGTGELASGLIGKGRMEEPEVIVQKIISFFSSSEIEKVQKGSLSGKKVVVTAGPTHESIDPVRFIGNQSSGKMGFAIANELADRGAEVILISGPVAIQPKNSTIDLRKVESASEMLTVVLNAFPGCDACIMCAAVADYTPVVKSQNKLKRNSENYTLELKPTADILIELSKIKKPNQIVGGFALETDNERENAEKKLKKKKLDFIVLNSLNEEGAGFHKETNKISIITSDGKATDFPVKSKPEVAADVVDHLSSLLK